MSLPIPQPPSVPFIGNALSVDRDVPLKSFELLHKTYGEIFQLNILGNKVVHVNTAALVREVSDEKKFVKHLSAGLLEVRRLAGDGLFTAFPDEHNWGIAHRLLMPAFGTANVRNMYEDMQDICSQLVLKWSRFGPDHVIDPTEDFTRLTLETIALCAMDYRFNVFYSERMPPFCAAMTEFLVESGQRTLRPSVVTRLMPAATTKYEADQKLMIDVASQIVAHRRAHPIEKKDLLNMMLYGKDPKTGEGLDDLTITRNLITFLIAGHETTSGMLSFAVVALLKHPDALMKLRKEIDEVTQGQSITLDHIARMPYLIAVMRETLRLFPTAPMRSAGALEDTVLIGKYAISKGQLIAINVYNAHRDPKIWGDDATEFRPERMLDGKFEALPLGAWQPFGFGVRACIGRPFAWQEAQLVIATIFQVFDLTPVDPSYSLELKQSLTVKPKDFRIHASLRSNALRLLKTPVSPLLADQTAPGGLASPANDAVVEGGDKQPLYVLYGSNTGTCESFANKIASAASTHGFQPHIGVLDSAVGKITGNGPTVIITASFEGQPADNAAQAFHYLEQADSNAFEKVEYAVFGCGDKNWSRTFQRIPRLTDELLEQKGAKRLLARGEGDASSSSFFEDFDAWEVTLWDTLMKKYNTTATEHKESLTVVMADSTSRAQYLRQPDAFLGTVVENRVLTKSSASSAKHHIEFALPAEVTYKAGDYLAILPINPPEYVRRVLAYFGLLAEQDVTLSTTGSTTLPIGRPVNVQTLLSGYVELSQPASKKELQILSNAAKEDSTKVQIQALIDSYAEQVLHKRISVLDILETHKNIELSFAAFLQLLPAMRIRQYSISSSPLVNPEHVTLTVAVVRQSASPGHREPFLGVASNYLANLKPGDRVQMTVKSSAAQFHPPSDLSIPIIMLCAGSGIAPMRGFIQERAKQKESGRDIAQVLLFFGCRSPDEDYLYSDTDLAEWAAAGVVDVRPAFSHSHENSEGCKHVQDRVWHDRQDIIDAYKNGGKFFICGSRAVGQNVNQTAIDILKDTRKCDEAEAENIWGKIMRERGASDVFE